MSDFKSKMHQIQFRLGLLNGLATGLVMASDSNMLHGWKDNSMLAKPLAVCTYLSSTVSELYDA